MYRLFKYVIIHTAYFLISMYQLLISSFLPASCRFYPSCSCYSKQIIKKHGFAGVYMSMKRILRCNPFSDGGIDVVN